MIRIVNGGVCDIHSPFKSYLYHHKTIDDTNDEGR